MAKAKKQSEMEWWSENYTRQIERAEKEVGRLTALNILPEMVEEKRIKLEALRTEASAHLATLQESTNA